MKSFTLLLSLILMYSPLSAEKLRFAVVPKEQWSDFFLESKTGCEAAARELGVECIFHGPEKDDLRIQDQIITSLIEAGVNGIAVAVSHSEFLSTHSMKKAQAAGVPVITYDSDFDANTRARFPDIRSAYIGTDNVALGRAAGRIAKRLRPHGGRLCIQSGREDQGNMRERIAGVRSELAGQHFDRPPGQPLTGQNGWTEAEDCPVYTLGDYDTALRQFRWALQLPNAEVDTFISVGGWIQYKKAVYTSLVQPYEPKVRNNEKVIIVSDSEPVQLELLKAGMAHGNFGQNPFEMGKQAIQTLYKIHHEQPYDEVIYTSIPECTQTNVHTCVRPH